MADGTGTGVELPNTVHQQLMMAGIQQHQVTQFDLNLAFARQRDGATYDQRVLGAVAAVELLVSDDPMQVAGLNTGMRTPTTVDHPSAIVSGSKPNGV